MNILFLAVGSLDDFTEKALYPDLIRKISSEGNNAYVVCANERRKNKETAMSVEAGINVLRVKTGNITKTNIIEKGISTLLIEWQFKQAIKKFFSDVKFDLVLFTSPPITFAGVVSFVKKRDNAQTYLLLKDIFPQNAVDIGLMTKKGIKSIIYKFFRAKEKKFYATADFIGCMSQANVDFLLSNNGYLDSQKVHINPNSIELFEKTITTERKAQIKEKCGIPPQAVAFIYGGNLGKPQDIPFIIECLKANAEKRDRFFVICGTGTELPKLETYISEEKPKNVLLINGLPKQEYEEFMMAFDVGLIFLDHRFTIPNFPSRLLSYMHSRMPVVACTDKNTDIGRIAEEADFGWSCASNNVESFTKTIDEVVCSDLKQKGENGFEFLKKNYTVDVSYEIIRKNVMKK